MHVVLAQDLMLGPWALLHDAYKGHAGRQKAKLPARGQKKKTNYSEKMA